MRAHALVGLEPISAAPTQAAPLVVWVAVAVVVQAQQQAKSAG